MTIQRDRMGPVEGSIACARTCPLHQAFGQVPLTHFKDATVPRTKIGLGIACIAPGGRTRRDGQTPHVPICSAHFDTSHSTPWFLRVRIDLASGSRPRMLWSVKTRFVAGAFCGGLRELGWVSQLNSNNVTAMSP